MPESLGEWLRGHRLGLGLSQEQLEKESGVAHTTIGDLERGKRLPVSKTLRDLHQLCDALGVSLLIAYHHAGLLNMTDEADRDAVEAALLIRELPPDERAALLDSLRSKGKG